MTAELLCTGGRSAFSGGAGVQWSTVGNTLLLRESDFIVVDGARVGWRAVAATNSGGSFTSADFRFNAHLLCARAQ